MMFGTREEFEYIECSGCGTIQIAAIPELSKYYPENYNPYKSAQLPFADKWTTRATARFASRYFTGKTAPLGQLLVRKKKWTDDLFPLFLREKLLDLRFDSRILDFGSGAGDLLNVLSFFGFRDLTGIDLYLPDDIQYDNGVEILKRKLSELEPSYDLIMSNHSLEHVPDPLATLQQIKRLLRVGKFCLIRMPVISYAWEKYGGNWIQLDAPRHINLFTEGGFVSFAESIGFHVEKVIYDSTSFQFWGSEKYLRDIPLVDGDGRISNAMFDPAQLVEWEKEAQLLNHRAKGDQASFYLRKIVV